MFLFRVLSFPTSLGLFGWKTQMSWSVVFVVVVVVVGVVVVAVS